MQKVSTAKHIQEELMKLHSSSMKGSLEDLSPAERKATRKIIKNYSIAELARKNAKIEVLKLAEYPEFVGREGTDREKRIHEKVMEFLPRLEKTSEFLLGDEHIAICLVGTHAKGTAGVESDVDITLLTKYINLIEPPRKFRKLERIAEETKEFRVEFDCCSLENAKESIWDVRRDLLSDYSGHHTAALDIFPFFYGKTFGNSNKIEAARKEIIQELAKNPYGEQIWEVVRNKFHSRQVVGLAKQGWAVDDYAEKKLRVSKEDYHEIVDARKEFALPSFEEMKRRYGVV